MILGSVGRWHGGYAHADAKSLEQTIREIGQAVDRCDNEIRSARRLRGEYRRLLIRLNRQLVKAKRLKASA